LGRTVHGPDLRNVNEAETLAIARCFCRHCEPTGRRKAPPDDRLRSDGNKVETFGPNPKGIIIFTANGRYALVLTRPDLPKIASKDRLKATPEEYQAVVQGSLAHFGTYSVNKAEGTYTLHVESSTYPNDTGTDQIRIVTSLSRDELKVTNPSPTTPTKAYVVYKRL